MERITTPAIASATVIGDAQIKKAAGRVPNTFAAIGAHGPEALNAVLNVDSVLAAGSLSKQELETVKLVVSVVAGCDYCVAAHSLLGKLAGMSQDVLQRIRSGEPTGDPGRDALIRFVRVLVQSSGTIAPEEFAAIKAAGYTDRQLVEISLAIAVTAFTNVVNRINDTAVDFPAVS